MKNNKEGMKKVSSKIEKSIVSAGCLILDTGYFKKEEWMRKILLLAAVIGLISVTSGAAVVKRIEKAAEKTDGYTYITQGVMYENLGQYEKALKEYNNQ